MAKDPLVFKVSKIGGDIACLFIGVKGTITAVTKAGKLIKIGRTASGMGKVIPVNFRPGLMPVATAGSSAVALEAAPQMIIENVQEASQALGILKTTLMQAGKVAGSGVVAGGGGFSLAHDVGSTSSTTASQSSTSGGSTSEPSIQVKEHITPQQMNQFESQVLQGKDIKFKTKEQALDFIHKKFPTFKEEIAGARSSEGNL